MTVIPFPKRMPDSPAVVWQGTELQRMSDAWAGPMARGEVSGWETGTTETGDPQLYVLGPAPDHDCLICISRLGRSYILEDGQGRILFEHDAIDTLAEQVRGALQRKKGAIVARAVMVWVAIRETFEDKVEPVLAEPMELLSLVAPQLGALA